ncbi:MAG: hypothetical protein ACI9CE_002385 [Flavobacterium sp.]
MFTDMRDRSPTPMLFMHSVDANRQEIVDNQWVKLEARTGAFIGSDAALCPDDPESLDYKQGIPHFKGFPGRVVKWEHPPAGISEQVLAR